MFGLGVFIVLWALYEFPITLHCLRLLLTLMVACVVGGVYGNICVLIELYYYIYITKFKGHFVHSIIYNLVVDW